MLLQPLDFNSISSLRTSQTLRTLPGMQHHSCNKSKTTNTEGPTQSCDCAPLTGFAAAVFVCCLGALQNATGHKFDLRRQVLLLFNTMIRKLTGSQSRGLYGGQVVFVSLVIRCPLTSSQVYCTHLSSGGMYVSFTWEAECLHRNVNKHQSVSPHTHS